MGNVHLVSWVLCDVPRLLEVRRLHCWEMRRRSGAGEPAFVKALSPL